MSMLTTVEPSRLDLDAPRLPLSVALFGFVLVMNVAAAVLSLLAA